MAKNPGIHWQEDNLLYQERSKAHQYSEGYIEGMFISFDIVTMLNIFKTLLTEHGDCVFHVALAGTIIQHPLDGIAGWLVAYDNTRLALL